MRLLTINKFREEYWYQKGENTFQVGQILSEFVLETLLNNARSDGATILDVSGIPDEVLERLIHKFFNGRGLAEDVENYQEALLLNGAEEIK